MRELNRRESVLAMLASTLVLLSCLRPTAAGTQAPSLRLGREASLLPRVELAARLVREAGFEPVVLGALERARESPVWNSGLSASALRKHFGLG